MLNWIVNADLAFASNIKNGDGSVLVSDIDPKYRLQEEKVPINCSV